MQTAGTGSIGSSSILMLVKPAISMFCLTYSATLKASALLGFLVRGIYVVATTLFDFSRE